MRTFTSFVSLRMQDVHILTAEQVPVPSLPHSFFSSIRTLCHLNNSLLAFSFLSPPPLPLPFPLQERLKQSARRADRDLLRGHWAGGSDGTTADTAADKAAQALVSALSACAATWWEYANLYK